VALPRTGPLSRTIKVNASDKDADTTHTQRFPRLYHRRCNGVPMMNYANHQRNRAGIEQSDVPVPSRRSIDDVEHNWGRVLEPLCKGPLFGSNPRTMTRHIKGAPCITAPGSCLVSALTGEGNEASRQRKVDRRFATCRSRTR
jgi:hypothetical protein